MLLGLKKAREQNFQKNEGKHPCDVGLIPLPVSTFHAWEENAAADLKEFVKHQTDNLRLLNPKLLKLFSSISRSH